MDLCEFEASLGYRDSDQLRLYSKTLSQRNKVYTTRNKDEAEARGCMYKPSEATLLVNECQKVRGKAETRVYW